MDKYELVVRREIKEKGPGVLEILNGGVSNGGHAIDCFEVITGGKETDCEKYGGLTPCIDFVMIETIDFRVHPSTKKTMDMARIVPITGKEPYTRRTFDIDKYPFMLHRAGISTGCIAIVNRWPAFKTIINEIFEKYGLSILVRNT